MSMFYSLWVGVTVLSSYRLSATLLYNKSLCTLWVVATTRSHCLFAVVAMNDIVVILYGMLLFAVASYTQCRCRYVIHSSQSHTRLSLCVDVMVCWKVSVSAVRDSLTGLYSRSLELAMSSSHQTPFLKGLWTERSAVSAW